MRILITGGCGFIGSNIADYYLRKGNDVTLVDNMSRKGIEFNLDWLKSNHESKFNFVNADIREFDKLKEAVKDQEIIFHTAAQVTMTDSIKNPRNDFEINALGTFNVLEAARLSNNNPIVAYTSTNKVYGDGANTLKMEESDTRWKITDEKFMKGIRDLTDAIVNKAKTFDSQKVFGEEKAVAKCPKCGDDVMESFKSFTCAHKKDEECKFVIWKVIARKMIDLETVKELIEILKRQKATV